MTRYLLDANIFLEATNRHYGFDFCPAFWDWLIVKNGNGTGIVASTKMVQDELQKYDNDIRRWANQRGRRFFKSPGHVVNRHLQQICSWVQQQNYKQKVRCNFLYKGADCMLIAHARAHCFTVVTHEVPSKNSKRRIKIPNVCKGLNVACISPFKMLSDEKANFVLG